jgi:lysyl-tRNA synthetase class II
MVQHENEQIDTDEQANEYSEFHSINDSLEQRTQFVSKNQKESNEEGESFPPDLSESGDSMEIC